MNDTTAAAAQDLPVATALERVLPLEGVRNFRDLGGYATLDGRRVRWRQIFRSASLGTLTARDHAHLEGLGLRAVFDLRATDERAKEPVRWGGGPGPRLLEHDYVLDLSALSQVLPRPDVDVAAARGAFMRLYEGLPAHFAAAYRALFAALLQGEAPLAFNCSAGKDRTGVGAALLLAALGVPRDTIVADYLLSNDHYRPGPGAAAAMSGRHGEWLRAVRPEILQVMLTVDASYLEAALAAIERTHGSIDGYLGSALGVDRDARDLLRRLYTES
jgi:protein-tyrosine phosphatase